ncbi:hypothetical protein DPMN_070876 [Dreissena polymorpha]|uniref:Uncharacterized protein n=1 Tax=Dreissena polymorpha TaxID=45954 RepID=A0A9D3Z1J6_DREPO|nr:hypothetical protein DPMN_070876 [Dreissena polymorpha]
MSSHTNIRFQLKTAERHFRYACQQVMIISRQVVKKTRRCHGVVRTGDTIFRYNIRLRLSILDGVRNMYYEFAARKAAEIVELQQRVLGVISHSYIILDETSVSGSESDCFELCD